MTATCSNCPYLKVYHNGTVNQAIQCRLEPCYYVIQDPNDDVCGRHPLHPGRVHELAAMAMQGLLSGINYSCASDLAWESYQHALALLAEAEKEGK